MTFIDSFEDQLVDAARQLKQKRHRIKRIFLRIKKAVNPN